MGIKLITEFMDFGPPLTATEWKAMVVLLEDANDGTRLTWSAVTDPKITRRVGLSPDAWTNLRGVLVRKKALIVAVPARRGRVAKYRIPAFAPSQMGHEIDDPIRKGHGSHDLTTSIGHEIDEETSGFVMGSMTPTPPISSTTSSSQPAAPVADPRAEGGGGGSQQQKDDPALTAAAAFLQDLPAPWTAGRRTALNLAQLLIDAAAAQGWKLDGQMVAHLTANPGGINNYPAVLQKRIDDLPRRRGAPTAAGLPPWCGECADGGLNAAAVGNPKFRTLGGGSSGEKCPRCHPDAMKVAA